MTSGDESWLRRKAKEQLDFIESSNLLFDQGKTAEGYRIAVALRILFHTNMSVIGQLNAQAIEILSTRTRPPEAFERLMKLPGVTTLFDGGGLICTRIAGEDSYLVAPLGDRPTQPRLMPVNDWLHENIFKRTTDISVSVTRYELLKWAANKDGGAHVDPDFPQAYEAFSSPGSMGTVTIQGREYPFEEAHLVALRQMGYEVLNSPALMKLAAPEKQDSDQTLEADAPPQDRAAKDFKPV